MSDHDKRHLDTTILERDDKGASKATGVLSLVFRKTLAELGVNATMWNKLMLGYLGDKRNRIPNNSRARSSTRGNLTKELSKPNMTWRNFEKGIRFLNPVEALFSLRLTWRNGKTSCHDILLFGEKRVDDDPNPLPSAEELTLLEWVGKNPGKVLPGEDSYALADELVAEGYLKTIITIDRHGEMREAFALDVEGYLRLHGEEG